MAIGCNNTSIPDYVTEQLGKDGNVGGGVDRKQRVREVDVKRFGPNSLSALDCRDRVNLRVPPFLRQVKRLDETCANRCPGFFFVRIRLAVVPARARLAFEDEVL